jgi:hypothetical protein
MCELRPGEQVECIDNMPVHKESMTMPELGTVYTIASVRAVGEGYSVRLGEIIPTCHMGGPCGCGECGWDASRFRRASRPVEDRLASLRALLDTPADFSVEELSEAE